MNLSSTRIRGPPRPILLDQLRLPTNRRDFDDRASDGGLSGGYSDVEFYDDPRVREDIGSNVEERSNAESDLPELEDIAEPAVCKQVFARASRGNLIAVHIGAETTFRDVAEQADFVKSRPRATDGCMSFQTSWWC